MIVGCSRAAGIGHDQVDCWEVPTCVLPGLIRGDRADPRTFDHAADPQPPL